MYLSGAAFKWGQEHIFVKNTRRSWTLNLEVNRNLLKVFCQNDMFSWIFHCVIFVNQLSGSVMSLTCSDFIPHHPFHIPSVSSTPLPNAFARSECCRESLPTPAPCPTETNIYTLNVLNSSLMNESRLIPLRASPSCLLCFIQYTVFTRTLNVHC